MPRLLEQLGPTVHAPAKQNIKQGRSWKDEEKKLA